jgi:para-aminobenzoate synthetase component I
MHTGDLGRLDVLDAVDALADLPGLVFLDSAARHAEWGRYSFVMADPFGTFSVEGGTAFWNGEALAGHPVAELKERLARYRQPTIAGMPPFQGGAAGFVAYEFGRVLERLPLAAQEASGAQMILHFFDVVLAFDHVEGHAFLLSSGWPETDPARRRLSAAARANLFRQRLARGRVTVPPAPPPVRQWCSNFSREGFAAAVRAVISYILAGDIFQANIAQRFTASLPSGFDPRGYYRVLRAVNPAPFAALLNFGDLTLASSSPERFLTVRGGRVETRPIKGTAKRSGDPAADRMLAEQLLASEKDRAENVMIVDLLRNDLSRVCRPHSVKVPVLCGLESFAGVHHLVSVVEGQLAEGRTAVDLLAAAFPGGSITGAPKIRAMEIITEIERCPRHAYCGAIGYFGFDGTADLNIAIRSVTFRNGIATFQAGGGITALSDPQAEYEETMIKAQRIFAAFGVEDGA